MFESDDEFAKIIANNNLEEELDIPEVNFTIEDLHRGAAELSHLAAYLSGFLYEHLAAYSKGEPETSPHLPMQVLPFLIDLFRNTGVIIDILDQHDEEHADDDEEDDEDDGYEGN